MIQFAFLFSVLYGVQAFSQSTTHYSRGVSDVAVWTFHQHLPPYPTSDPVQFLHTNVYQFQLGLLQGPHLERRGQPGFYCRALPKRARSGSTANSSVPVPQVQYLAGSYEDNSTGGARFNAMWNANGSAFQSMLVRYEVAFDAGLIRISFSGTFGSTESTRLSREGLLKRSC